MSTEIYEINPIPIFSIVLNEEEAINVDEMLFVSDLEMNEFDNIIISKNQNILEDKNLDKIKQTFFKYLNVYVNGILGVENFNSKISSSWLSLNSENIPFNPKQLNSTLSCLLFYNEKLEDNEMSRIIFNFDGLDNIFRNFQFNFSHQRINKFNSRYFEFIPCNNSLVFFPSWISHFTLPNTNGVNRYCLRTNFFIDISC